MSTIYIQIYLREQDRQIINHPAIVAEASSSFLESF